MKKLNKDMYSIGDISKLLDVSIKTLRYYDKIDLLKPEHIDEKTNYRYYSTTQIMYLYVIKELKYQGFSLANIKRFLESDDLDEITDIYVNKENDIQKEIDELQLIKERIYQKIERLEMMKHLIKNEKIGETTLLEAKEIPERQVVYIRKKSPFNFMSVTLRTIELFNIYHSNELQMIDPYMIIFYDGYRDFNMFQTDFEICAGVDTHSLEQFKSKNKKVDISPFVRTMPKRLCATAIRKGSYEKSIEAYDDLIDWIDKNGYTQVGPLHKVYITNFALTKTVENMVYELQIPIKK